MQKNTDNCSNGVVFDTSNRHFAIITHFQLCFCLIVPILGILTMQRSVWVLWGTKLFC